MNNDHSSEVIRAFAFGVTASLSARTISGVITTFDRVSNDRRFVFHAGSIRPRQPINRVKLLLDHDLNQPVGYMASLSPDTRRAVFTIPESPEGDRALAHAANGLRDGFSVGLIPSAEAGSTEIIAGVLHVYRAEMHEVSLVAVPAFADATVQDVAAALVAPNEYREDHPAMETAPLTAMTQADYDSTITGLGAVVVVDTPAATTPAPVAAAAAIPIAAEISAGPVTVPTIAPAIVSAPVITLNAAIAQVTAAAQTGQAGAVLAALTGIIPANDGGLAFLNTPGWLGELFTAGSTARPWVDSIGTPAALTSLKTRGWRWTERPKPLPYAGNLTDVPSNPVGTVVQEYTAKRYAGGWEVDRAFIDFADPEFTRAFFTAASNEYKLNSDAGIATDLIAGASAGAAVTTGGVVAVLKALARDARAVKGGRINRMFLGNTLFDALADLPADTLPIWLKQALVGIDVATGSAGLGTLQIQNDATMLATTAVAFDTQAVVVREKTPIQVSAEQISKGGVDLGFFSYLMLEIQDPRLVLKRNYTGT